MQIQILPNILGWQSEPLENLVNFFPEESRQKNENKIKNYKSTSKTNKRFLEITSCRRYPDFRYFCSVCGTLDVLIKGNSSGNIEIRCLECKKISIEKIQDEGIKTCLC